jgi:hypothetical protein
MADTRHVLNNLQNKSSDKNTEQIDIDSTELTNCNDNICPQCGKDHSYKITAGNTILDMISLFDRDASREV